MKKRLALVLAAAAAMGSLSVVAANADALVNTPIGSANVDPATGITLDGNSTNPDPLDGYLIITPDGTVHCSDQGGPYNDNGTDDPSWNADPSQGNDLAPGCNPTLPPPPVG